MTSDTPQNLKVRLISRTTLFMLLLTLVLGTMLYFPFKSEYHIAKELELDQLIDTRKNQIEQFFNRLEIVTGLIASQYHGKQSPTTNESQLDQTIIQTNTALQKLLHTTHMIQAITVVDPQGKVLGSVGKVTPKQLLAFIQQPIETTTHFTDVMINNEPMVITATPVRDEANQPLATAIVLYRAERLRQMLTDYQAFYAHGEPILGHLHGHEFKPISLQRDQHKPTTLEWDEKTLESMMQSHDTLERTESGITYLYEARSISGTPMILLIRIPKEEFFSLASNHYIRFLLAAMILLAASIIGIRVYAAGIIRHIEQEQEAREKAYRELENYKVELETRVEQETNRRTHQEQIMMQQARMAVMGEMMSYIAHQWRQPLSIFSFQISALESIYDAQGKIDKETLHNIQEVSQEQISFMNQTIDDFRSFFKTDRKATIFRLCEPIHESLRMVRHRLRQENTDLRLECDEGMMIEGFSNEIKHVIINLISNAADAIQLHRNKRGFSQENYPGFIQILVRREEGKALLQISDNGGGIPENILSLLFQPYVTSKGEQGTGVGLYMCHTIVVQHMKGSIDAENRDGGAVFSIRLNLESN